MFCPRGRAALLWNSFDCCFLSALLCPVLHMKQTHDHFHLTRVCVIMCLSSCICVLSLGNGGYGVWSWTSRLWLNGVMYERTKRRDWEIYFILVFVCLYTHSSGGTGGSVYDRHPFWPLLVSSHYRMPWTLSGRHKDGGRKSDQTFLLFCEISQHLLTQKLCKSLFFFCLSSSTTIRTKNVICLVL